jgi:hypothetical protein
MGLRLGISVAAMCLVTNDFAPFAMLDAATRAKGEDALIQAVLAGLLTWNNMTE